MSNGQINGPENEHQTETIEARTENVENTGIADGREVRLRKLLHLLSSDIQELVKGVSNDLDEEKRQNETLEIEIDRLRKENEGLLAQIQQLETNVPPAEIQTVEQLQEQLDIEKQARAQLERQIEEEKNGHSKLIQTYRDNLNTSQREAQKQRKKTDRAEDEARRAREDLLRREEELASFNAKYKDYYSIQQELRRTRKALKKKEDQFEEYKTSQASGSEISKSEAMFLSEPPKPNAESVESSKTEERLSREPPKTDKQTEEKLSREPSQPNTEDIDSNKREEWLSREPTNTNFDAVEISKTEAMLSREPPLQDKTGEKSPREKSKKQKTKSETVKKSDKKNISKPHISEKTYAQEKRSPTETEDEIKDETTTVSTLQSYQDEINKCQQEIERQKKKVELAERETRKAKEELLRKEEEIASYRSKYRHNDNIQKQLEQTKEALRKKEDELEDYKTRLSKQMGDKLTDSNPTVADLSDKNRPTKLADRYQEVYDNEWTNAYETLDSVIQDEEKTIASLISILKNTRIFCDGEAEKQMVELQTVLTQKEGVGIPTSLKKQLKDIRKLFAEYAGTDIFERYLKKLQNSGSPTAANAQKIPEFLESCFKISWLMAIQDPPVAFGPDIKPGSAFNTDQYKAYTKTGRIIMFVVWPSLHLHENGPVLCKGIAQGEGPKRAQSDATKERKENLQFGTRISSTTTTVRPSNTTDNETYLRPRATNKYLTHTDNYDLSNAEIGSYPGSDDSLTLEPEQNTHTYDRKNYAFKLSPRHEKHTEGYEKRTRDHNLDIEDYDSGRQRITDLGLYSDKNLYSQGAKPYRMGVHGPVFDSTYRHSGTTGYGSGLQLFEAGTREETIQERRTAFASESRRHASLKPNFKIGADNDEYARDLQTLHRDHFYNPEEYTSRVSLGRSLDSSYHPIDYTRENFFADTLDGSYQQRVIPRKPKPAFKERNFTPHKRAVWK